MLYISCTYIYIHTHLSHIYIHIFVLAGKRGAHVSAVDTHGVWARHSHRGSGLRWHADCASSAGRQCASEKPHCQKPRVGYRAAQGGGQVYMYIHVYMNVSIYVCIRVNIFI